jgi:hypothetical protein
LRIRVGTSGVTGRIGGHCRWKRPPTRINSPPTIVLTPRAGHRFDAQGRQNATEIEPLSSTPAAKGD